jgi:spore maturation protein CgeB
VKFVLFYHSLVSDWNHGNAHFLRGIVTELLAAGHDVQVYEPSNAWSRDNLVADHGVQAWHDFEQRFPQLRSQIYELDGFDPDRLCDGADAVIVHEWNPPELLAKLGRHRRTHRYKLLFHDTHHRCVTAPHEMARFDFRDVDGVLAFGEAVRQRYLDKGWCARAWTWHEAADTSVFHPHHDAKRRGDLVWIGNWGDGERARELQEFLIEPVRALHLSARLHGVRYPEHARKQLAAAGIDYLGYLPNWRAPDVFGAHRMTVHVPRGPYAKALPGIPTIRVFEALACGIPLISAPWSDSEHLFTPGRDFLVARNGEEMQKKMRDVLEDAALARELARHGLHTILQRHTCAHRARELVGILRDLDAPGMRRTLPHTTGTTAYA